MPYNTNKKKNKKGKNKKGKYKRRKSFAPYYKSKKWLLRMPSMLPDSVLVPFKYVESFTFPSTMGTGSQVWSMNSIFDPNVSGGGHQVLGYDQWNVFYSRYEVLASKIFLTLLPPDINPTRIALYPALGSTPASAGSTASEQPYAITKTINGSVTTKNYFLKNYMTIRKLEGRATTSVDFTSAFGASPVNERYWICVMDSLLNADITDIICEIKIIYYTRLYHRINVAGSS